MSRPRAIVCDVCGERQREGNGWLNVELVVEGKPGSDCHVVVSSQLEDEGFNPESCFDVCGESCAVRKVQELLPRIHGAEIAVVSCQHQCPECSRKWGHEGSCPPEANYYSPCEQHRRKT